MPEPLVESLRCEDHIYLIDVSEGLHIGRCCD
jgi:hypothetical protein